MKILAYTSPARGHLYPLVPILDELAGRGHEIAVRTLASEVALMAGRGFDAAPLAPAIEAIEHDDYRARTPPAKLRRGDVRSSFCA
jgi:UDP:flavonoid glycosyltransferase YjiC (YdhE family)